MSDKPPAPPGALSTDVIDLLNDYSPDRLRDVASYAEKLADYREREARRTEEDDANREDQPNDLPDGVPSKATITIKTINDNRYYYWQWRDGDTVRSKYKGPVGADE